MKPESEETLAEAIRGANGPLCIMGGGTRGLAVEGEALETGALSGIRLYEPGALTMVAGAGTPLAEIEAALAAEGQMLAFEPYDLAGVTRAGGASTIGGVFATNASGSRRVQAGAARDFLLGVRFVDGAGNIVKNGGRVMKNVTGYDLVKLIAGSHGTLGVLTEVAFKVLPKPETQAHIQLEGLDDETAIRALSLALGSPYDVTGAVHAPDCVEEGACTAIRIEGFAASVAYHTEQLSALWSEFCKVHVAEGRESWAAIRNLSAFSQTTRGAGGTLWRIATQPSVAPALMADITAKHDVLYQYDLGGGRIWLWSRDADIPALHADLQSAAARARGHATLIHSPTHADLPRFQPEPAAIARLTAGLRQQFDPRGILNPGLLT